MKSLPLSNRIIAFGLSLFMFFFSSCVYYDVHTVEREKEDTVEQLNAKYHPATFYLHTPSAVYRMDNIKVSGDKVSGQIQVADKNRVEYALYKKAKDSGGVVRVRHKDVAESKQLHIYSSSDFEVGAFELSGDEIVSLDYVKINTEITVLSFIGTGILIGASVIAIGAAVLVVIIATACGCPHVYTYNGSGYVYNNTLFTGAIAPQIERDDYQLMPDFSNEGDTYQFWIKNEEQEIQYVNNLDLMVVEHEQDQQVYTDQSGRFYTIQHPISPEKVTNSLGESVSNEVNAADDVSYLFDTEDGQLFDEITAQFKVPENTSEGRLIVRVKNSLWAGFVYEQFSQLFGSYHDNWVKKNQEKTGDEMLAAAKEQGIPLVIEVKERDQWKELDVINLVGEVGFNTLAVSLDNELLTSGGLTIRLRSGFKFWELDYLAVDFTVQKEVEPKIFIPRIKGDLALSRANLITGNDSQYLILEQGDSVLIAFDNLPNSADLKRTVILHSRGYYLNQKTYSGRPDMKSLKKFEEIGGLSAYSRKLYEASWAVLSQNQGKD